MSGGSFDYLCFKMDDTEIFNHQSQLEDMISNLSRYTEPEFVAAFQRLVEYRRKLKAVEEIAQLLLFSDETSKMVAHTWEWFVSCDYGEDTAKAKLRELLRIP